MVDISIRCNTRILQLDAHLEVQAADLKRLAASPIVKWVVRALVALLAIHELR